MINLLITTSYRIMNRSTLIYITLTALPTSIDDRILWSAKYCLAVNSFLRFFIDLSLFFLIDFVFISKVYTNSWFTFNDRKCLIKTFLFNVNKMLKWTLYCCESTSIRLYNPLRGAYYRCYRCRIVKPRYSQRQLQVVQYLAIVVYNCYWLVSRCIIH